MHTSHSNHSSRCSSQQPLPQQSPTRYHNNHQPLHNGQPLAHQSSTTNHCCLMGIRACSLLAQSRQPLLQQLPTTAQCNSHQLLPQQTPTIVTPVTNLCHNSHQHCHNSHQHCHNSHQALLPHEHPSAWLQLAVSRALPRPNYRMGALNSGLRWQERRNEASPPDVHTPEEWVTCGLPESV